MRSRLAGTTLVATSLAGLAAVLPMPPALVERYYSNGVYPLLQRPLTGLSNLVPVALLDVVGAGLAVSLLVSLVRFAIKGRRHGWARQVVPALMRVAAGCAFAYLLFLGVWGLNYRRLPLTQKIVFEPSAVTRAAAVDLARRAARRINATYDAGYVHGTADDLLDLKHAFDRAQRALGIQRPARPARPKFTLLDAYFRATAVDGMTDPFLLETLVVSSLLEIEKPFVVAHEWSHLAGFADEGEANFVGWLTCMGGGAAEQYSGWLFLYREIVARLSEEDRAEVVGLLAPGPRADLQAIAERHRRDVSPTMSRASWRAYDRYLRANRVAAGAESYAEVVTLVLGARFDEEGNPQIR